MLYPIVPSIIPKTQRAKINKDILSDIKRKKKKFTKDYIYNSYSGLGGLHDLNCKDFANYYEYSQAKKEFELGQFFTPHQLCRQIVEILSPSETDLIMDMCCGMGNFFNHLPNLSNVWGFDIDENAVNVAKYLYPQANLQQCDISLYETDQYFDMIIGNPPYNLQIEDMLSQFYYFKKAHKILKPTGFLIIITPLSFLQSNFWESTKITAINRDFSFIGQSKLPANTFAATGVDNFETKIMVFTKASFHLESKPYQAEEFLSLENLKSRIEQIKVIKEKFRIQLMRETHSLETSELERFEYLLKKYLFEFKAHKKLHKYYQPALALITKLKNQTKPKNCSDADWEKKRLTPAKVLTNLKKHILTQNYIPRKEIALVKTSYSFKLKAYAPLMLAGINFRDAKIYDLVLNKCNLPEPAHFTPGLLQQYSSARKLLNRKKKEFTLQNQVFVRMQRDPEVDYYLKKATFINKEGDVCQFTDLQKKDLSLVLQKKYALLNWQQGSGKTAAAYHYAKFVLEKGFVKNIIILAPAIATNLTWVPFLDMNNEKFQVLKAWKDFENIPTGIILIVPISMLSKLKKYLIKLVKLRSRKICLLFDESDEITNPTSQRTRAALDIFRRVKYKILATGTTTRNNINELYSQLEILYNNSVNMMCRCYQTYHENKERHIEPQINAFCDDPFPPKQGHNLFKACFCPGKVSVFGIEKQNQDIYNQDELIELIDKTIITRKFREFAGEKYNIRTHAVTPSEAERKVYQVIIDEFLRICEIYFSSTGDKKKDAGMRLMRQIKLLIRACSTPHLFLDYRGAPYPTKTMYIRRLINRLHGKVAIGCTSLSSLNTYYQFLIQEFPERPIFVIKGEISFKKRQEIIAEFESTIDGLLICTQQSLKSSANIPGCNEVIIESLQWNIPKMEQFYFRFIRLDSKEHTTVHYITYEDSIEQNLMALVLTKERLNEFIKSGEIKEQSEIFDEFDISESVIQSLFQREKDKEGKFHITWGSQRIS